MVQKLNWYASVRRGIILLLLFCFASNIYSETNPPNTHSFFNHKVNDLKGAAVSTLISNQKLLKTYPKEVKRLLTKHKSGEQPLNLSAMPMSGCADVEFIDLRNVPGYPQINDLSVCGSADTLSMMIFTGDPGEIKGFEFEIDFPNGIEYAGWEYTQLGGTSIAASDPDPNRPTFLVNGITGDSLVIVNIGVRSICEVDKSENLYFDYNYEFVFLDTTNMVHQCSGSFTPLIEFNSAVNIPVLNMLDPISPATLSLTELSGAECQTIEISQDGLSTYVDSFTFEINGLELFGADLILDSIIINGLAYPKSNLVYDPLTFHSQFLVDGSYFPSNSFNNPADNRLNTNELVTIEICYRVDECPITKDFPFNYYVYYGCDEEICQNSGQTAFIEVRPSGATFIEGQADLGIGGIEICGDPGQISILLNNSNIDIEQNAYTDIQIGFQTCNKPNLDVTDVIVGGIAIPDSLYEWVGDDINIDFSKNKLTTLGLQDYDLDGFYDDLAGGTGVNVTVEISIDCGVNSGECNPMSCPDNQFYVDYKTNCGNSYKQYPEPDKFSIQFAADTVFNVNQDTLNTAATIFGYDFGKVSNNGLPIVGTNADTVEVEFCYDFIRENISDCPTGPTDYLYVEFIGAPVVIMDVQFVSGSGLISTDGGMNYVPAASESWSKSTNTDALLILEQPTTSDNVCYKYKMEMDSCICTPVQYFIATQKAVSICGDCTPDCEIVKACRQTTLSVDQDCTECRCIIDHDIVRSERKNLGYTDKTMTSKHTRESLTIAGRAVDLARFVPGDTLIQEEYFVILDNDALNNLSYWAYTWYFYPVGLGQGDMARLPLTVDFSSARLLEYAISKGGVGVKNDIDVGAITSCTNSNTPPYQGARNYWNDNPWSSYYKFPSLNSAPDYWDNSRIYMHFFNYENIGECGGTEGIRAEGNCLDDMIATYNIEVGDTIWVKWDVPLIKNPLREALKAFDQEPPLQTNARVISYKQVYKLDDISGNSTHCASYVGLACREELPLFLECPEGPSARTEMNLTDCGGTVTHEFWLDYIPGEIGDPWFTEEYRPLADILDVKALIRAPLAYCAGGQAEHLGVAYPLTSDSSWNMFCVPIDGYSDELCAVDTGDSSRLFFNLKELGIPALGYGKGNCDTIKISYDLCMVCPGDINDVLKYDLLFDWKYTGDHNYSQNDDYLCNHIHATNPTPYLTGSICDDLGLGAGTNWFDEMMFYDTLMGRNNDISQTFVLIDNRDPLLPVGVTNEGSNFLASIAPGVSIEIQEIEICNTDPDDVGIGVGANVIVPNSVRFENAYSDVTGTMILNKQLIADDGSYKSYSISLPEDTLAIGECRTIYVGTTLLYCPSVEDPAPKICVGAFSGCSAEEVKAALSASGGCGGSEVCYTYVFGEVGLQTEWFDLPAPFALCDTVSFSFRVKNVKQLLLLDLKPMIEILSGLVHVSGSWEVAYPGGPTTFGPWTPIGSDPDIVSGNEYGYSDDVLWSSHINLNGLQGVTSNNVTADSNKVSFRFRAYTECDQFLSGGKMYTETTSTDPCSDQQVTSGFVESPSIILAEANPADYAQLLTISEPEDLVCEGLSNTFGITVINSGTKPTADSVRMCITIPEELTYIPTSLIFTSPTGFVPGNTIITPIGTKTEVCFDAPALGAYGTFGVNFEAVMDTNAPCGDIRIGTDIKSVVDMINCEPGPPDECSAFVQNSLNSYVNIKLKPPFAVENLEVFTDCAADPANVSLYYEYDINHSGPSVFNQSYTINFYEDIDGSQTINPNVDNLLGSNNGLFSVNNGSSIQISGAIDVPEGMSCPVLFEVIYITDCVCDREEFYYDKIELKSLRGYDEPITMCPRSCIDIEVCDYVDVVADSIIGATGVPYTLEIDWEGLGRYTLPRPGLNLDSTNYESLTDNSEGGLGHRNVLLSEGSYDDDNAFLVAHYTEPVTVSSVFLGGGNIAGWTHPPQIGAYTNTVFCLEYSHDNITWTNAGVSMTGASNGGIEENTLPSPIGAQHWRLSSCGAPTNWATSEFRLEGDPLPFQGAAPVSRTGNTVTVCIPEGVGIDRPWEVEFTTGTGSCMVTEILEIWGIDSPGITLEGDTTACENQCVDMEIIVPNDATAGMTVSWTPSEFIVDPTAFRVEACSLTMNTTFQATISYNDGACIEVLDWPVEYFPENDIDVQGEDLDCYNMVNPPVLTGDLGWDLYNWYQIINGTGFIAFSSTKNSFIPSPGATYYLVASRNGTLCPAVSTEFSIPNEPCLIDLGDLPDASFGTGTNTNYETLLANNGPSHVLINGLYLGTSVDDELDGQPTANALGDGSDENGISIGPSWILVNGGVIDVPLIVTNTTGQTAYVEAWIDWNGDGDFNDPNEMVMDFDDAFSLFPNSVRIHIPMSAVRNTVIGFRLRISNEDDMTPYGNFNSGEIEDYLITIDCKQICVPVSVQKN